MEAGKSFIYQLSTNGFVLFDSLQYNIYATLEYLLSFAGKGIAMVVAQFMSCVVMSALIFAPLLCFLFLFIYFLEEKGETRVLKNGQANLMMEFAQNKHKELNSEYKDSEKCIQKLMKEE